FARRSHYGGTVRSGRCDGGVCCLRWLEVGASVYHSALLSSTRLAMTAFTEQKTLDLVQLDQDIRAWWEEKEVFEAIGEQRADGPVFTFYEGPPTANGRP